MTEYIKITLRIPPQLHQRLKRRAQQKDSSLNRTILETIEDGLEVEKLPEQSERERLLRLMRERGLIVEPGPGWKKYASETPSMTHAELREMLKGVPPLSEAIIEEREPR
jgi:hypothetical protein